jgi:GR25 family glycosyltransferase involved in LPS biosynthesis
MCHPSRSALARVLADQCAPLRPALVVDPDPASFPSPLRTAKRAWAAVGSDVTHHLVLQDDVVLSTDFLTHLPAIVARLPEHGIALYVNRGSLRNAYLARRSAAVGSPWSRLSGFEYLPTLGFLLPAQHARQLAAFLATYPDEFRDDDEIVALFCRTQEIPVVASVPNLIEHGNHPSIAGNGEHGERRSVVFADQVELPAGYWERGVASDPATSSSGAPAFVLEFYDSRCLIRFTRPGSGEPVDHLYGWYWHDWCALLGASADHVLATWEDHMAELAPTWQGSQFPVEASTELWAAGYLLGHDTANVFVAASTPALRPAIQSWLAGGLAATDRRHLDAPALDALADLCLSGIAAGARAPATDSRV